jgi:transposase-like protein
MPCLPLILLSSVVVLLSWPVRGPNRSPSWRRSWVSASRVCGNWLAQAEADDKGSQTRLTSAEKKELAELRRDKRRLELEVEILKRAAAYSPGRMSSQTDLPAGP